MEKKLKYFLENIHARSQRELEQLDLSLAAVQEEARKEGAAAAAEKVARYKEQALSELRNVNQVELDARQTENRRRLLEQRQVWADETAAKVTARVRDYTAGPEYPGRLAALLASALDVLGRGGPVTVYLRREDMALAGELQMTAKGAALSFMEGEFGLGGLIAASPKLGRRVDLSFDTALEAARDRFGELAGLELD